MNCGGEVRNLIFGWRKKCGLRPAVLGVSAMTHGSWQFLEKGARHAFKTLRVGFACALAIGLSSCATDQSSPTGDGVGVGQSSSLRNLVPAEQLEGTASTQYSQILQKARAQRALAPDSDPQVKRLRSIAHRIIPHVAKFNARAPNWKWEVNLIRSNQINAFCMPGGKIAFYSAILTKLRLSDDEVGVIMGHEIAHALREHARARVAKAGITSVGAEVAAIAVGGGTAGTLVKTGANLLTLKYSRDDETDADLVGIEVAARAGFDPRAGVTLWRKMSAAARGAPLEWFSTHPANDTRIATIQKNLPTVMPLYENAKRARTASIR